MSAWLPGIVLPSGRAPNGLSITLPPLASPGCRTNDCRYGARLAEFRLGAGLSSARLSTAASGRMRV